MKHRAVRRLGAAIKSEEGVPPVSRGIIMAVYGSDTVANDEWTIDVAIEGSSVTTRNVGCMATYAPTVGDSVWVFMSDAEPWVLGKMTDGVSGNYPLTMVGYAQQLHFTTRSGAVAGQDLVFNDPEVVVPVYPGRLYRVDWQIEMQASKAITFHAWPRATLAGHSAARIGAIGRNLACPAGAPGSAGTVFGGFAVWQCPDVFAGGGGALATGTIATFDLELYVQSVTGGGGVDISLTGNTDGIFDVDPGATLVMVMDGGPF